MGEVLLTKEEFVKIINRLEKATEIQDKVSSIFRSSTDNIENDFMNAGSLQISHESVVVDLLEKIFCDEYFNISYFIYELNYGKEYKPDSITDTDGNTIDFSTAEKLYDYLVECKSKD